MNKLHRYLENKSPWYARWHMNPAHSSVHFGILAFAIIGAYSVIAPLVQDVPQSGRYMSVVLGKSGDVENLNKAILQLSSQYDAATPENQAAILGAITKSVAERRVQLRKEMKGDPQKFLRHMLPKPFIKKLPSSVQPLFEEEEDAEGTLTIIHQDDFTTGKDAYLFDLDDPSYPGKLRRLHFSGKVAPVKTGDHVKVKGVSLDDDFVVLPSTADPDASDLQVTSSAPLPVPAPQTTIVMAINFTNDTGQTWTLPQIASTVFDGTRSTNSFYQENSFDQIALTGDVVGWYTIPYTNADCDGMYTFWMSAADTAATNAGVNLANYSHKVYLINNHGNCTWGGMGTIGGGPSWAISFGYNDAGLIAHEMGHNFTEWHAQSINCGSKTISTPYSSCIIDEYGEHTDVMGNSWMGFFQFNAPHKAQVNWFAGGQQQTVSASGTYTLAPVESMDTVLKSIKIAKPDTGDYYFLTYRQPLGTFDATLPVAFTSGVAINLWGPNATPTKLLDSTAGDSNFSNAPLADGRSFTDTVNGITVTQNSHSSSGAVVTIQFGPTSCVRANPTVSAVTPANGSGASLVPIRFGFTVYNHDGPTCGTSTFAFATSVLPAGWTSAPPIPSAVVGAGSYFQIYFEVTPPADTPDGVYPLTWTATDTKDPVRTVSASANYLSYQIAPLAVTITNPLDGAVITGTKRVRVTAEASYSTGIKSIVISLDGKAVKTCTSSPCSYDQDPKKLTAGQHTITATATSKDGVTGSTSIHVTR